jgi:hypothetical protein
MESIKLVKSVKSQSLKNSKSNSKKSLAKNGENDFKKIVPNKETAKEISEELAALVSKELPTVSMEKLEIILGKELAMVPNTDSTMEPNIELAISDIKKLANTDLPETSIEYTQIKDVDNNVSMNPNKENVKLLSKYFPKDSKDDFTVKPNVKINSSKDELVILPTKNSMSSKKASLMKLSSSSTKKLLKSLSKSPALNSTKKLSMSKKKTPTISPVGFFNTFNIVNKFIYETLIHNENYNFNNKNLFSLDLSKFPKISKLYCNNNKLTELDLSKSTHLEVVECNGNQITHLDLSNLPKLKYLYCNNNKITELDLSKCPYLETVEYKNNNNNIKIILNKNYVLRKYLTDKLYYALNSYMSKGKQSATKNSLYDNLPLDSYIDVINKNMTPLFKNSKKKTIFSLTNITKNDNGCYKLLKGNLTNDISRVMWYFRFFDIFGYQYEFDDDVLAIDIYKHNNYTLYDSVYKIMTLSTPKIYETEYLLINPNVDFKYVGWNFKFRVSRNNFFKSELNQTIENGIYELFDKVNDEGLNKLNELTKIDFNKIFEYTIALITNKFYSLVGSTKKNFPDIEITDHFPAKQIIKKFQTNQIIDNSRALVPYNLKGGSTLVPGNNDINKFGPVKLPVFDQPKFKIPNKQIINKSRALVPYDKFSFKPEANFSKGLVPFDPFHKQSHLPPIKQPFIDQPNFRISPHKLNIPNIPVGDKVKIRFENLQGYIFDFFKSGKEIAEEYKVIIDNYINNIKFIGSSIFDMYSLNINNIFYDIVGDLVVKLVDNHPYLKYLRYLRIQMIKVNRYQVSNKK